MEYSKDQILFLDILIKKSKSGIWMNLYQNSTDTQICLPLTYSHPNHWKQNISFCLAQRICTTADNNTEKLKSLDNSKSNLSKCHYPHSLLKPGFQKASSTPTKDLQKPSNESILSFITTYNPNNPNSYSTIKSSVNCLKNNNVRGFNIINLMQSKRYPQI